MSGVSNNQVANQTTFNNAFMARNGDTNTIGKLDLDNGDTDSGATIANIQREMNANESYTGLPAASAKTAKPAWVDGSVGTGTDSLKARAEALTAEFNPTGGHTHDGVDSAVVDAADLANVRLKGYFIRGTNLVSVTGSSLVVTSQMSGKTPSTGDTVKGVVVSTNNQVILRDNTTATQGDQLRDGAGDLIYGRIEYSAGVWTLGFYKNVSGVQTAHSFTAQDIGWYYQELFSPTVDAPIYSELASVPSDNATQDVVDATSTQRGLVSTGAQSLGGEKTFTDTTQSTTKDTGAVILEGGLGVEKNVNAGGNIAAVGTMGASNLSGTNTGDESIGAFGSTPNANGLSLTAHAISMQPADATHPGGVSTAAQEIAGPKTFIDTTQSFDKDTGGVILQGGLGVEKNINAGGTVLGSNLGGTNTGDLVLGSVFGTVPNTKGATLAGQTLTLQPADDTNPGLLSILAQRIGGIKTFAAAIIGEAYLALRRFDVSTTASITQLSSATSFIKLTGSTASTVHGAAAGTNGQCLTVHNSSGQVAIFKHQSGTATAVDRFLLPGSADISLDSDSSLSFIYDTGQSRWVISSGSGSGSGSGGASSTPVQFNEGAESATPDTYYNSRVYRFADAVVQYLYTDIRVPAGYTPGKQIKLKGLHLNGASVSGTKTMLITASCQIVRPGTDLIYGGSVHNSTNSAVNATSATQDIPQAFTCDLSDASGVVGVVAAAPGDMLRVFLNRNTFADTLDQDVIVYPSTCEVTFNG